MTLEDFVLCERQRLENFYNYWLICNSKDPEQFPLDIPESNSGMWNEMLASFD